MQFKCNTIAKSVTPVQKVQYQCKLHIVILDYDLKKDIEKVVGQWSHVNGNDQNFVQKLWKNFSPMRKKRASRNIFRHFFHAIFFMFVLLIRNHPVFLVQFGINLHLRVFQKAEIALAEAARAISALWKTHSCKLIPNWTRNRMITYTNWNTEKEKVCFRTGCR